MSNGTPQRAPQRKLVWLTAPNIVTIIRLLMIPVMAYFILSPDHNYLAFALFLLIWSTDVLDGFLARRLGQISDVGKVLDPLTDKLFQLVSAFTLWLSGRLALWVPILLLVNQLAMIIGGAWLWRNGTAVQSSWYGKVTTVLFAIGFAALFLLNEETYPLGNLMFIIPIILLYYSTIRYGISYILEPARAAEKNQDG